MTQYCYCNSFRSDLSSDLFKYTITWGLKLKLTNGRQFNISDSNDFPALYKDLVRAFKPFMKRVR